MDQCSSLHFLKNLPMGVVTGAFVMNVCISEFPITLNNNPAWHAFSYAQAHIFWNKGAFCLVNDIFQMSFINALGIVCGNKGWKNTVKQEHNMPLLLPCPLWILMENIPQRWQSKCCSCQWWTNTCNGGQCPLRANGVLTADMQQKPAG